MSDSNVSPFQNADARRDADRIANELVGLDEGTDPFVAAVRATRMPMIITDPRRADNPVVFTNDAFCRLTGYTRDEILGRNCRFLQGPETDLQVIARIRAAVQSSRSIEVDIRNYRKNGELFWNRLLLAPVYDTQGVLAYFFASQVDVTLERERLEGLKHHNTALTAELADRARSQREQENDLRFALETGRFGAWTLDLATEEFQTSAVCRINFGRDPQDPLTYPDFQASVHPDDRRAMLAAMANSIATASNYDIDYRVITPHGETRWAGIRGRPIYAPDGKPLRMSGIALDVTEQKRAERLRQALADLGSIFRDELDTADLSYAAGKMLGETLGVSRAGYGTIDADAETLTVERSWNAPPVAPLSGPLRLRDYGSFVEDLKRGQTVVFSDSDLDPRTAAASPALKAIGAQAIVNVPVTERGGLVALLFLTNATARSWHADELDFVREIADRTRAAIERRRAEKDLARLAASLEQQVADRTRDLLTAEEALRQSQKMEAIGQLTGGVAHDFNNLLTVIRSSVDLMRRPNLPEERRRRYIDAISETVNRAAKLTGQLLAFARRQALNPEPFDARERLRGMADMIDTVTGARIRVVEDLTDDSCFIRADLSQFETTLVNMAVNARDAMDGEGVLTLRLTRVDAIPPLRGHAGTTGRFAAVSVADTGRGISPDDLPRIFEPFFTTKDIGKGTGLGLSQVFGFAKQSGGDVDVRSEVARGTTFTLYLPEIDAASTSAAVIGESKADVAQGGAGRRVLIVEDNIEVGRFSTQLLQDLGYQTVWAVTAAEALAKLKDAGARFDVVFSDVVMPGISGIDLGKQIRHLFPDLPVVLTSGYSHVLAEEGTHGFELLHKPYSAEQLSRVLQRASMRRAVPL